MLKKKSLQARADGTVASDRPTGIPEKIKQVINCSDDCLRWVYGLSAKGKRGRFFHF
jgi:hypothetical protein